MAFSPRNIENGHPRTPPRYALTTHTKTNTKTKNRNECSLKITCPYGFLKHSLPCITANCRMSLNCNVFNAFSVLYMGTSWSIPGPIHYRFPVIQDIFLWFKYYFYNSVLKFLLALVDPDIYLWIYKVQGLNFNK